MLWVWLDRASYKIFFVCVCVCGGGGDFLLSIYCRETMWLIDNSEGEGVGGGCAPSHAAHSAEAHCLIPHCGPIRRMLLSLPLRQLLFIFKISVGGNSRAPTLCMKPAGVLESRLEGTFQYYEQVLVLWLEWRSDKL